MRAPLPVDEEARLDELAELKILDSAPEKAWDRLVEVAAAIFDTPIALFTLVDKDRQWFKARIGMDVMQTPRDHAFCAHAILDEEIFIVEDATKDARFADNPLVTDDPNIRFYAGAPVRAPGGHALGTLCVIDRKARTPEPEQLRVLEALAAQAEHLLEVRQAALTLASAFGAAGVPTPQAVANSISHDLFTPLTPAFIRLSKMKAHANDEVLSDIKYLEAHLKRLQAAVEGAVGTLMGRSDGQEASRVRAAVAQAIEAGLDQ